MLGLHLSHSVYNVKAENLTRRLVERSVKVSVMVSNLVKLLEMLDYQCKLVEKLGYCDFDLAYVLYIILFEYFKQTRAKIRCKSEKLYLDLEESINRKDKVFTTMMMPGIKSETTSDPLQDRLKLLKGESLSSSIGGGGGSSSNSNTKSYRRSVSPIELKELLNTKKVLLIDYRLRKDYLNNHIKHTNLVNIEPKLVESLPEGANDADLEDALKATLPFHQLQKFQQRHKFDYVIIYNYKYGVEGNDTFLNILNELELDDNEVFPFARLIDLLVFKNKYISSSLKLVPSYLSGGVLNWYKIFGNDSLERSESQANDMGASNGGVNYSTSLNDYISKPSKGSSPIPIPKEPVHADYKPVQKMPLYEPNKMPPSIGMQPYNPPKDSTSIAVVPGISSYREISNNPKATTATTTTTIETTPASSTLAPISTSTKSNLLEEFSTGLVNLGNSCYMNCMVQCLAATRQLTSFFFPSITFNESYKQHINVNNKLGTQGKLTRGFVELILNMLNKDGGVFTPSKFKRIVGELSPGKQFATYDQQDSIEFLNYLLDGLHEDLNQMAISDPKEKQKISELTPEQENSREILPIRLASTIEWERYLKLNFSIVVDKFQGQYLSRLKCLECGFTSTSYNAFSNLSLPIPEKLDHSSNVTLKDCLDEFITTELLDDENKWFCPKCKKFTKSTKTISITRLPQVLIINFKRFKLNPTDNQFKKLETFVTYPVSDILDLTKYWPAVGSTVSESAVNGNRMKPEEEQRYLDNLPTRNQQPPFRYKLFGVANHFGNLTTGHYTAYVYKKDNKGLKNWCYFDDSKITFNVSPNKVLNKNAYCLFFQRV
ncbi:DOA4 [Candida oxycetoniae]|uniref:Ubiquitin carboxyl-terminal hydrolase n=1 Tax=Candida oxycetoniae TaxID=497107 RepID=A0AAI9SX99_9ASCO|nr:DOA4 [Candida oxycetoniae]KAI3404555.2 DOA4 [Candida oxycetoniae]